MTWLGAELVPPGPVEFPGTLVSSFRWGWGGGRHWSPRWPRRRGSGPRSWSGCSGRRPGRVTMIGCGRRRFGPRDSRARSATPAGARRAADWCGAQAGELNQQQAREHAANDFQNQFRSLTHGAAPRFPLLEIHDDDRQAQLEQAGFRGVGAELDRIQDHGKCPGCRGDGGT